MEIWLIIINLVFAFMWMRAMSQRIDALEELIVGYYTNQLNLQELQAPDGGCGDDTTPTVQVTEYDDGTVAYEVSIEKP